MSILNFQVSASSDSIDSDNLLLLLDLGDLADGSCSTDNVCRCDKRGPPGDAVVKVRGSAASSSLSSVIGKISSL